MDPSDEAELRRLVERYASIVDDRRFDDLDQVFTSDSVLETGRGRRDGLAEIRAAMAGLHRYDRTDHRVLTTTVATTPDGARGTVAAEAHHWFSDDGRRRDHQMEIAYHDRYVATPAGWRIAHRRLEIHRAETVDAG
ncbi:MAG: nuclear transport factor 2 family protein [Actinomycetota bacterium]